MNSIQINQDNKKLQQQFNQGLNQNKPTSPLSNFLKKFKYTNITISTSKIIILAILFVTLIIVYLALILISTQKKNSIPAVTPIGSPISKTKVALDPQLEKIQEKIKDFYLRLDTSFSYSDKLKGPIVDLNINF